MDVGFETIGNATLICYDKKPIIVTDPWIEGSAYLVAGPYPMRSPSPKEMRFCSASTSGCLMGIQIIYIQSP